MCCRNVPAAGLAFVVPPFGIVAFSGNLLLRGRSRVVVAIPQGGGVVSCHMEESFGWAS